MSRAEPEPSGFLDPSPLVGREHEALAADRALAAGRSVVLVGPAGCGKTRLAFELARLREAAGGRVAFAHATPTASDRPLGVISTLLPGGVPPAELRANVLHRAAEAITDRSGRRPTLVFVDDAQHLDDLSAAVLLHVASATELTVLVTVRAEAGPPPDAVLAVWKHDHADRLDLGPLDRDAVDELARRLIGAPLEGGASLALWETTEGSPLFVHELIRTAVDEGRVEVAGGVARLVRGFSLSRPLTELVEARMDAMAQEDRTVLELIAVAGSLTPEQLSPVADLETLVRLEDRGLVRCDVEQPRRPLHLAHSLHGGALIDRLDPAELRDRRDAVAGLLEASRPLDRDDLFKLAALRLEAGAAVDAELGCAAAQAALATHDDVLAVRLAEAAVRSDGGVEAMVLRAQGLMRLGDFAGAIEQLTAAEPEAADDRERVFVAVQHAIALYWGLHRDADATTALAATRDRVTDPVWRAELDAQVAGYELLAGKGAAALARAEPLLDHPEARVRAVAAFAAEPALVSTGRAEEAVRLSERGLVDAMSLPDEASLPEPGFHVLSRVLALTDLGRLDEAAKAARTFYDAAVSMRSPSAQAWMALALARVEIVRGGLDEASRFAAEATALSHELRLRRSEVLGLRLHAQVAALSGADDLLEDIGRSLEAIGPVTFPLFTVEMMRADAWVMAYRGDLSAARRGLADAAGSNTGAEASTHRLDALHDLARLGAGAEASAAVEPAMRDVDGSMAALSLDHIDAAGRCDIDGLERVSEALEALAALPAAADAAAAASALARDAGDDRRATADAVRAATLAARCGGLRTPALDALQRVEILTGRERQLAELAAGGASNREIAEHEVLSVRTVENTLQRVYRKLGVSGRSELPDALQRAPLS